MLRSAIIAFALGLSIGCASPGVVGMSPSAISKSGCDAGSGKCYQCSADADCASHNEHPLCGASSRCVECRTASDCSAQKPMCIENECKQCARDADCARDSTCVDGSCQSATKDDGTAGSGDHSSN